MATKAQLRDKGAKNIYPVTKSDLVSRPGGGDVEAALAALEGGRGLRKLFEAAGAKYNEATGFYELNGLTDITEAEMVEIYVQTGTFGCGDNYPGIAAYSNIRTNIFIPNASYTTLYGNPKNLQGAFRNCRKLEVCKLAYNMDSSVKVSNISTIFESSIMLREVIGILDVTNSNVTISIYNTQELETFKIKCLHENMLIDNAPKLSLESFTYMVDNATNTKAITITVHPDVMAKFEDEAGHPEWHALMQQAAEKQISFATNE